MAPTRCAVCDMPGKVLCESCMCSLPYVDQWRACPRCGAPFGLVQCCSCNDLALSHLGLEMLPFQGCISATMFKAVTGHIVRVFKDLGEQRLAADLALLITQALPPAWHFDAVAYIPASRTAFRRRGYDHAKLIAEAVANSVHVPILDALERPMARDQRQFGRAGRLANIRGRFKARSCVRTGPRLLLVDDVCTTGATLCAASSALVSGGAELLYCATFARA